MSEVHTRVLSPDQLVSRYIKLVKRKEKKKKRTLTVHWVSQNYTWEFLQMTKTTFLWERQLQGFSRSDLKDHSSIDSYLYSDVSRPISGLSIQGVTQRPIDLPRNGLQSKLGLESMYTLIFGGKNAFVVHGSSTLS